MKNELRREGEDDRPKDRRQDRGSYDKEKKSNKNKMKNNLQHFVDNYNTDLYNSKFIEDDDEFEWGLLWQHQQLQH